MAYFGSTEVSINNYLAGLSLNADRATLLYYPHAAPSDYSWTGIALSNPNISNTELTITPYAQDGTVLTGLPHILSASENYVGTLESLGFPAQTSWFKIESDLPVAGFELFGTKDGRQMAGLNAFTKASDSGVFPKHDTMERTDIAFVNVGRESTAVVLTAFDNTGNTVATASKTLSPYEKAIGRAADFFTSSIQTATYIRYTSDNPLIGYQINGSGDGYLLDSLPADINGTDETSASETSQLGYTIVDTGQTTYYGDSHLTRSARMG